AQAKRDVGTLGLEPLAIALRDVGAVPRKEAVRELLELCDGQLPLIQKIPPVHRHQRGRHADLVSVRLDGRAELSEPIEQLTHAVRGLPTLSFRKQELLNDTARARVAPA